MSEPLQPADIFLLDDEPQVTDGLVWLLESVKLKARVFHEPQRFIDAVRRHRGPLCAVLDLRMPRMSGLEVQQALVDSGHDIPLFFLTAHGDVPAAVNAMQGGAMTFLQKPFRTQEFLDAVNRLLEAAVLRFDRAARRREASQRLDKLSARELEVLERMLQGMTSKEIARALAISPKTVDVHRSNLMRKLDAESVSTLHKLVDKDDVEAALALRRERGP